MRKISLKSVKNTTISSLFAGIVVIMAMFMTVACEKDETSVADQQQTVRKPQPISDMEVMQYLPKVVDGRLVFKDEGSYLNYVQWIFENQGNPKKIHNLNHSLGFISLQEIYDEGIATLESCNDYTNDFIESYKNVFHATEIDNSIIQDMQAPPVLSYITNSDGVYQLDERIIRVMYDFYYVIMNGDASLIPLIVSAKGQEVSNTNIKCCSICTSKDQYSYRTNYFDSNHRMVSRLRSEWVEVSYFYRAITNSQQKILGVWLGRQLDGVWVSWPAGYWYVIGGSTKYVISANSYGASNKQTIDAAFAISDSEVDGSRSYCKTTHKCEYDDEELFIIYNNSFLGTY